MNNELLLYANAPEEAHPYLGMALRFLIASDIGLEISEGESVDVGALQASGVFDPETACLGIAIGKPFLEWFPTFMHEHCHAIQFTEGEFKKLSDNYDDIFDWVSGKELADNELDELFRQAIWIESDCENRTVGKIHDFNLELMINPKEYAQKSNAYVQFYQVFRKTRKWYDMEKAPYKNKDVWSLFPTQVFLGKMNLTSELEQALLTCCG